MKAFDIRDWKENDVYEHSKLQDRNVFELANLSTLSPKFVPMEL
jgi:hypothetical protein